MLDGVVPQPPEFAARWRQLGYWKDRTLWDTFRDVFARYDSLPAVRGMEPPWTFEDVHRLSVRMAGHFWAMGIRPLDRVIIQLPNVAEFIPTYFGLQQIGAVPIMALPSHRHHEVSQFVAQTDTVLCIGPSADRDFSFAELYERLGSEFPSMRHAVYLDQDGPNPSLLALLRSEVEPAPAVMIDPDDPAVMQLSGGTTGVPKLIPRSHNDYVYNSEIASAVNDIREGDVLLGVLPVSHNLPLACPGIQGFFLHGASVVLSTSARASDVFATIERHGVTHLELVPALLIRWLNDSRIGDFDLSSVRVIQSGGQSLQPEIRLKAERLFPSATVQENFGMAEGLLMFVRLDDPRDVWLETVGRPLSPHDEVRLVDEADREVPDGEVGEMLCRGPYTLRGYYRAEEHNRRAFTADGFYRSGDLMFRHESGNYVVAGRKKDLINRGGEKISAEEVENLILSHPDVIDVACVAYPDEVLGERMCACLILRAGASITKDELAAFLLGKDIAKHKLPERVEVMDVFPLSPMGKVSKKDLALMLAGED